MARRRWQEVKFMFEQSQTFAQTPDDLRKYPNANTIRTLCRRRRRRRRRRHRRWLQKRKRKCAQKMRRKKETFKFMFNFYVDAMHSQSAKPSNQSGNLCMVIRSMRSLARRKKKGGKKLNLKLHQTIKMGNLSRLRCIHVNFV